MPLFQLPAYLQHLVLPDYFYHWTSDTNLRAMAQVQENKIEINHMVPSTRLPIYNVSGIVHQWQPTDSRDKFWTGFNVSTDPVFGMGTQEEFFPRPEIEIQYSRGILGHLQRTSDKFFGRDPLVRAFEGQESLPEGKAARLITIKLRKDSRIGLIVTAGPMRGGEQLFYESLHDPKQFAKLPKSLNTSPNESSVDVLLHLNYGPTYNLEFQEWIIINPAQVEWFSADPRAAQTQIEESLRQLDQYRFKDIPFKDKVFNKRGLPRHFRGLLRHFLASDESELPIYFRNGTLDKRKCLPIMTN